MKNEPKKRKFPSAFVLLLFAIAIGYTHGYRIVSLEEIPSSHRPAQPFFSAEYGATHLSLAE